MKDDGLRILAIGLASGLITEAEIIADHGVEILREVEGYELAPQRIVSEDISHIGSILHPEDALITLPGEYE